MSRHHLVRAPSNIALIKYMGKTDAVKNLPENPSLSMTLDALATWVSIRDLGSVTSGAARADGEFLLVPGVPEGALASAPLRTRAPVLSAQGREKVLRHCQRAREEAQKILPAHGLALAAPRVWELTTGNTFPEASGIASSASSFAALTLAVTLASAADPDAFGKAWRSDVELRRKLARVSRVGSGSSCRSFEGPWVLWEGENAAATQASSALPELTHYVLLISSESKSVSSSEAHARVKTSPLWSGRPERVARRLELLRGALEHGDLAAVARLAWTEAWEMHSLFHTSADPFSYWKPGTIDTLHWLAPELKTAEPPIVTMDAGPNVHVTVPSAQAALWRSKFVERFGAQAVLEDRPGRGAEIVS